MLQRLSRVLPLLATVVLLAPSPLWPHGGGLDTYGCHHNRVHGGYHCHRGAFKGAMFDSNAEMLRALETPSRSPAKPDQLEPIVVQEFTGRVVGVADGDTITAALLHQLIESLPQVASAVVQPLGKTERMVLIRTGGSDSDGVGASKIGRDVASTAE